MMTQLILSQTWQRDLNNNVYELQDEKLQITRINIQADENGRAKRPREGEALTTR